MRYETRSGSIRTRMIAVAILLAGSSAAGAAAHQQTPTPRGSGVELVIATVRSVDAEGSTLEVINGVGLALRSVHMQVAPACRIQASGRAAGLADVRIGMVVRVGCRRVSGRLVAESIEIVPPDAGGGP